MKIRKMTAEEFWPLVDKANSKVFSHQFYPSYEHMSPHEAKGIGHRKRFLKERIELFFGLFDEKNKFVGWSCSFQIRINELYMMNSGVLPKYRRSGWYTKLAKATMNEAKKLGFQLITSNHLAANNPIILAKLKLGFQIVGVEVSDEFGTTVKLSYFISPLRKEIYTYRTGLIYPSNRVKRVLKLNKKSP